jgi:hypothetical protein
MNSQHFPFEITLVRAQLPNFSLNHMLGDSKLARGVNIALKGFVKFLGSRFLVPAPICAIFVQLPM